jgi:diguanylate cyclase (GGDEF)-like protein
MTSSTQTHLISIIILILLYVSIKQQSRSVQQQNRYYLALVVLNVMVMIFKIAMDYTSGYTTGLEEVILKTSTALYYMTSVVVVLHWLLYLHHLLKGKTFYRRVLLIAYAPFLIMSFVSIALSAFGLPIMYTIKSGGGIERHIMYSAIIFTEYLIMIGSVFYVIWNKNKISKFEYITLIAYLMPPAVGIVLNEVFTNVDLIWPSMTVSLVMVYTNIQSRMSNTDPLTGVFNRREYEKHVQALANQKNLHKKVCAIMIDIDNFKKINDEESHLIGDQALMDVSQILQKSVRKNDFIARIGGDEFCIMIESEQIEALHHIVNRINEQMNQFNKTREGKNIRLSMGYGVYDAVYHKDFRTFFEKLDRLMYDDKLSSKQTESQQMG